MKINISDAAKTWGKSRQTIYNHLKAGEISATKDSNGNSQIDTAELIRVFGEAPSRPSKRKTKATGNSAEVTELRHQLEIERLKRESAEAKATDLEKQRDSLAAQIERLQGQHEKALDTFGESIKLITGPSASSEGAKGAGKGSLLKRVSHKLSELI